MFHNKKQNDMRTDFSINVQVNLGVTPELEALVRAALAGRAPQTEEEAKPLPTRKAARAKAKPKDEPQGEEAKAEEAMPRQAEATEADKPKGLTEEDVRAAIHRARLRIEGEDYKDNTEGEAYKKYHRAITAACLNFAALLGADKPSALAPEQRQPFITMCDELAVQEGGKVGTKAPY